MNKRLLIVPAVLALAIPAWGQTNLLQNPSFSLPTVPENCNFGKSAPELWLNTGGISRNADIFYADCPRGEPADYLHASMVHCCGAGSKAGYQSVTLPAPADGNQTYRFSGWYVLGSTDAGIGSTAHFDMISGTNVNAPPMARQSATVKQGQTPWTQFSLTHKPPAGTSVITVAFKMTQGHSGFTALHVDDLFFGIELTCPDQPSLDEFTPIAPALGMRGTTVNVAIAGTNFSAVNGTPVVRLTGPQTILASGVSVSSSSLVQATFNIPADAVHSTYDLIYEQPGCTPATAPTAFLVYLPALSNASFENPAVTPCNTPLSVVPTDWRTGESNEWGYEGRLKLNGYVPNGTLQFKPSCPTKDGNQYGTMASLSGTGGANAIAYQTFAVAPGASYTLSGYWAGSGDNRVILRLRDGGPGAAEIVAKDIHEGAGNYDWSFNFITGTSATGVMTADWAINRMSGSQNATHADALVLEQCTTPIAYLSGVTPAVATNDSVLNITDISGSGFEGSPTVFLSKPGFTVVATDVVVVSGTKLTCSVDLTGVPGGRYSLFVKQGGCIESLPDSIVVVAAEFVNGDFEEPAATLNCGPPPQGIGGLPTGWTTDTNLFRNGNAPLPPSCPSPAGGNYGTMSFGGGGTLRAWQTVRVVPGQPYTFSGGFGGAADCVISLLDGDEFGSVLQSQTVYTDGSGGAWLHGSVTAIAVSQVMTVVWEIQNASMGAPGGHADGLSFGSDCPLNWADTDGDGDVDMDDFAQWQRCVTISGEVPDECRCLDRVAPYGKIDLADFPAFAHCVSGPNIPWTGCEP